MKKSLTKLIVSCAAVTAVAAAMAVSASAANVSYDKDTTTITNSLAAPAGLSGQATILVQTKTDSALTEGDIFYIDQQASEGTVPEAWKSIKVAALADGTYVLKMGGTGVTALASEEFTVGEVTPPAGETVTVLIGDVNGSKAVDGTDALIALRYYAGNEAAKKFIVEGTNSFRVADVNDSKAVDGTDALIMLRYYAGNEAAKNFIKEMELPAEAAE